MPHLRVLLVDDHEVVREGLKMVLESDHELEVVGGAADGVQAVQAAIQLRPDLVLMDVMMARMDGIQACREIKSALPQTVVVMLTSSASEEAVEASILAGASGYILKTVGRQELLRSIKAVGKGESRLDPGVTRKVMERLRDFLVSQQEHEVDALTARELEVLGLVGQGRTNREIAEKLIISEYTARNHVIRIMDKLQLPNRVKAALYASEHRIVPREDAERG